MLAVANTHKDSHIAPVILAGVDAFRSAATLFAKSEAVSWADRAMSRFESRVRAQMRLGTNALATIAAVAPFVGLLGTTVGIFFCFGGSSMAKSAFMAMITDRIARALVLTAASLAVGVVAMWSHNCITRKAELLDAQIATAILQLTMHLNAQSWEVRELAASGGDVVCAGLLTANRRAEIPYERGRLLLPYLWTLWLYFMYAIFRAMYWHFAG